MITIGYKNLILLFIIVFAAYWVYGVNAESVTFGYQPDSIQFAETGNSYILNNSELEIEFFKDTLGYNQYRNARNGSVLIYDARIWVDYLGPGDKWKTAGIAQTTSYQQIYKGYEVTRHYTGIQADYDVVYTWIENRPVKHIIYITGKVEDDFQVSESYDGVVGTSKIEKKSVYAGDNYNLIISIQDVVKSFGNDFIDVTESTSANGKKFDYTFGSWELNFSDMDNGSHQIQIDPSVEFNGTDGWAGTTLSNLTYTYATVENDGKNLTNLNNSWAGNDVINRPIYAGSGYIVLEKQNPFSSSGTISKLMLYATGTRNFEIRIFRENATHYIFVSNTSQMAMNAGLNRYDVNIDVQSGDYLGFYIHGATLAGIDQTTTGGSISYRNCNLLTDALKSTFTNGGQQHSIYAYNFVTSGNLQIDNAQDAGANQAWKHWHLEGTDQSDNTSLAIQANVSNDNSSFSWVWINSSCNVSDNITASVATEYRYLGSPAARFWSNTSWQSQTNIISNITITSALSVLPPQNLTNSTEQTQICYNWDDYASADKWNISQRIASIPYTDVIIVLDGAKDAEFTDRAHTWILDSPNPTGTNGDKESISWIRNTTTLSGYADGEDNDGLPNDDSFTIMIDMTGDGLTADDRQFILSESGTVTAKRGPSWLPQATNAVGVVIGAGVAGDIQYEMQIPISELTNFNNGSTIKLAMAREDTSQNPDVTKYYPKGLINDTDPSIWTSINLTAASEYTFLGNTTLSNYTVTGLSAFTWYRHRFSTINGSTESSYVYSNDITEDTPQYTVSGYILTESGSPISGADVWSVCDCGCVCEVNISNASGYYQGDCFYNGTYTISASAIGYDDNSISVVVNGANQTNQNITLSVTSITDEEPGISGGGGGYLGDVITIIDIVDEIGEVIGKGIRIGTADAGFTIDLVSISNILTGKDKKNTWTLIGLFSLLLIIVGFFDKSLTARGDFLFVIGLIGGILWVLQTKDILAAWNTINHKINLLTVLGISSAAAFIYGFFIDQSKTNRREFLTVTGLVGIFIYAIYQSKLAIVIGLG